MDCIRCGKEKDKEEFSYIKLNFPEIHKLGIPFAEFEYEVDAGNGIEQVHRFFGLKVCQSCRDQFVDRFRDWYRNVVVGGGGWILNKEEDSQAKFKFTTDDTSGIIITDNTTGANENFELKNISIIASDSIPPDEFRITSTAQI